MYLLMDVGLILLFGFDEHAATKLARAFWCGTFPRAFVGNGVAGSRGYSFSKYLGKGPSVS